MAGTYSRAIAYARACAYSKFRLAPPYSKSSSYATVEYDLFTNTECSKHHRRVAESLQSAYNDTLHNIFLLRLACLTQRIDLSIGIYHILQLISVSVWKVSPT